MTEQLNNSICKCNTFSCIKFIWLLKIALRISKVTECLDSDTKLQLAGPPSRTIPANPFVDLCRDQCLGWIPVKTHAIRSS